MKFISSKVALYLLKSTIMVYIEYCCDVLAKPSTYYLDIFDKLQKQVSRTVVT